jgi:hypothetical protein
MTITVIDYGGVIGSQIALGQHYAAIGAHLAIKLCVSACILMLLQVPKANVCIWPDAWFGFHSAAWHGGPESAQTMVWMRGRQYVRKWGYRECGK